jgi:hypothetical protein
MRYQVLVELKATRIVTLDAASGREAIEMAEDAAFPGRHRRDKVKGIVASGYPKRAATRLAKPRVEVPD